MIWNSAIDEAFEEGHKDLVDHFTSKEGELLEGDREDDYWSHEII